MINSGQRQLVKYMGRQILQDPLEGKTFNEYPHDIESVISYICPFKGCNNTETEAHSTIARRHY